MGKIVGTIKATEFAAQACEQEAAMACHQWERSRLLEMAMLIRTNPNPTLFKIREE